MWINAKLVQLGLALFLLGSQLLCRAQTPTGALHDYLSQSIAEANSGQSVTIAEWTKGHPGEVLEEPMEKSDPRKAYNLDAREQRDVKQEGRWCLKSIATIELAGSVHVRRVALFYPPLVEQIYDKPLPPLPTETGGDLRRHGCRLVRILHPDFLLKWEWGTLGYGEPSDKTINPEAGQPWLALRAAKLAHLPEGPTLDMLAFLAPQVGDTYEQAPLHCERQLIPVVRKWLDLAALAKPEQHAAAILLAHEVLSRLWDCTEFSDSGGYVSPEDEKLEEQDKDALEKDLQELGIKTELPARLGNEHYAGNLRDQVLTLAPEGLVNELGRMAILDERCHWSYDSDSADCAKIIQEGESFLTKFPEDEWTPTVHLILAEAYALTTSNPEEEFSATPQPPREESEKKAAAHYRAWYAKSKNERDRALVWQEIWAIEAGMGPSLLVPVDARR